MHHRFFLPVLLLILGITGNAMSADFSAPLDVVWELSTQNFGILGTYEIGLADLDGDDDLDAVFSNYDYSATTIYFNDGNGYFTISEQTLPSVDGHGIGLADYDLDGDIDLFVTYANYVARSRVYLNDGTGYFVESGQVIGDASLGGNMAYTFDIDEDGDSDVLVDYYQQPNLVYENDGTGVLLDSGQVYPEDSFFADLDADGDTDILECDEVGLGYRTWINDGFGDFTELSFLEDLSLVRGHAGFGDLDNDGDTDAVVANGTATDSLPTKILFNDGTGVFSVSPTVLAETSEGRVCIGDLNHDGYDDIILTSYHAPHQVLVNDGEGGFVRTEFGGSLSMLSANPRLTDVDSDGRLDFVVPNIHSGFNEIWFNRTPESCCGLYTGGYTGNCNCDNEGKRNLADISRLIDRVYISKDALCCEENGNVNGDIDAKINLADISVLIDHVYITKDQTAACE